MWTEGASHMCNVHNALFQGFNSIYQQATHVQGDDKAAFLGYCQTWVKFLKSHTEHEESGLFVKAEELLQEELFKDMVHAHGKPLRAATACRCLLANTKFWMGRKHARAA